MGTPNKWVTETACSPSAVTSVQVVFDSEIGALKSAEFMK